MVESENEFSSACALSWADEVELEEALAAVAGAQELSIQKPNPFGNARPREVVLQERGINWKKIELDIQQSSLLQQEAKAKMLHKQSISTPTPINRKQSDLPSWHPKLKLEYSKLGFEETETFGIPHNQSPIILVAPLRYPPKTIAGKLFEPEKESRLNELGGRNFHSLQRLNPTCHNHPCFVQQALNCKSMSTVFGNGGTRSDLGKSRQAQNDDRNLGKPVSRQRNKFSGQNLVGLSPKSGRVPPQSHHGSCIPAGDRDQKHIQHDYAKNVVGGHLTNPSNIVPSELTRRNHIVSGNNKISRMVGFTAKEAASMESAVSGVQPGAPQNIKIDGANYFGKAIDKDRTDYSWKHKRAR